MATTAAHPKQSRSRPRRTKSTGQEGSAVDRLQQATGDVERMTERASGDLRKNLDDAVGRMRDIAADLRKRAEDEATDLERTLEEATEDVRREVGRRAVRAQGSLEALSEMSAEIRRRRSQLSRQAKAAGGAAQRP